MMINADNQKGNCMKWLEVIELHTAAQKKESLDLYIKCLFEDLNKESNQVILKVLSHVAIDCDYLIQLSHQSQQAKINGSDFGLRLVQALKNYGLVNHSVWVERFNKQENR